MSYPANPNSSPAGIAGLRSADVSGHDATSRTRLGSGSRPAQRMNGEIMARGFAFFRVRGGGSGEWGKGCIRGVEVRSC